MIRTIPRADLHDACAAFAVDPHVARVSGAAIVRRFTMAAVLIADAALHEQLLFFYAVLLHDAARPADRDPESIRALAAQTNRTLRERLFGPIGIEKAGWQ